MKDGLTPEQRSMRARIAAQTRWGRAPVEQRRTQAAIARKGFIARFLAEVDQENPGLADAERHVLAEAKLSAHMTRLAFASSKARKKRT